MKVDVGALLELLRKGPPDVIGYEAGGRSQRAFEHGWRANAERLYTTLRLEEAREAKHDALLVAFKAAAKRVAGEASLDALREYREAYEACIDANIAHARIFLAGGFVTT